jgi:predicted NBD/HSP70 family sugar kinase
MMIGLELQEARAVAVAINGSGEVLARASVDSAADLAVAAATALRQITSGSEPGAALGVASGLPESFAIAPVLDALARRYPGPYTQSGATPSGTAAAVAEAWIGAGRDAQDLVYFAVGDHTTGGIIRGGIPVTGTRGRAASVAWLALNPVEREDYRKMGCLEAEVAAAGIVRRMIWRIKSGDRSRVQETVDGDLSRITVEHVLNAARNRDGVSISVVRDTAKYLGMAAANLVVVADPDTLVLGGIMASAGDLLLDPLRAEIARRLPRAMMDALAIVPAALGDDAPAVGAARLVAAALQ